METKGLYILNAINRRANYQLKGSNIPLVPL